MSRPCILCHHNAGFHYLFLLESSREQCKDTPFIYKECSFCQFGVLDPLLIPKEMATIYDKNYFIELAQPAASKLWHALITIQLHKSYISFVRQFLKKGKLLDIGCGNGEFLHDAEKKGFHTLGLEPFAKKDSPQVKKGSAEHIPYESVYCDGVTMWHVFEHVTDIHASIKEIKRVLKPGGYFIFEVPNAKSLCFRLFKNDYAWKMVPEHSLYFSEKNLVMLLLYYGFSIENISYPMKANLNFALSVKNKVTHPRFKQLLFIVFLPLSLLLSFLGQFLKNGEVIRIAARKRQI